MKKHLLKSAALVAGVMSVVTAGALPNMVGKEGARTAQLKGTAATCVPALAKIDLDINNVRARLMTGGDMWWDPGLSEARYEVPKGSRKSSLFAGSLWVGGFDANKNLKVAAQTYRQNGNDYWPGPLDANNAIDKGTCSNWDQFWKVNKSDVIAFQTLIKGGAGNVNGPQYNAIKTWPANGNADAVGLDGNPLTAVNNGLIPGRTYAPFVDLNGDGAYQWAQGEYPAIFGDQYIWWVFNDAGAQKLETGSESIGLEVQASAFAFGTKDFLNDATFYNYRLINRGSQALDSTYVATWTDADLGNAFDDFIGCDTSRSLGILYNGKTSDGNGEVNSYGTQIPMVGVDFFIGPKRTRIINNVSVTDTLGMAVFSYYNNIQNGPLRNPQGKNDFYNYMSGTNSGNAHIRYDFTGPGVQSTGFGNGPLANAVFSGDPGVSTEWSECACGNSPNDRRFIHSAGPFRLEGGGITNNITIGVVWVADAGGCPNTSFRKIRSADDQAQELFDNGFRTIEGPEAPRLVVREMDRKLVMYLLNDSSSTNFQERFGQVLPFDTVGKYRVAKPKMRRYTDSLYKFEGYRVFQLKNANVNPSQIFDATGKVNAAVAAEVFTTDVRNGVTQGTNWVRNTDNQGGVYYDNLTRVIGTKDSGIRHSFVLSNDAFANGLDKQFVNYRNYYFVAIAYAYNNFAQFNTARADSTQDQQYIESSHGGGGIPIPVVAAMPNPANGDMGTVLNADYGSGVILKRIEGTGNGHNSIQIDRESEDKALAGPDYRVKYPTYLPGQGPVDIKVVDPRKVIASNWELYIYSTPVDTTRALTAAQSAWKLVSDQGQVIQSERNLTTLNEQILEKYGLSVSVKQVLRPGQDQQGGNGYIGSDVSFADPTLPWLAGVNDFELKNPQNWIRSGKNIDDDTTCEYSDNKLDTTQNYENMLNGSTPLKNTWAPYALAAVEGRGRCGFGVSAGGSPGLALLQSVDVVFTSDKSKWTRCMVIELQDDKVLSENGVVKFYLRNHRSWTGDLSNGQPVYSSNSSDTGMSWFPGYAINQESGERLNIVFGEDSYLKSQGGDDMIWNPSGNILDNNGNVLFGGKHYVYVMASRYDSDKAEKEFIEVDGNPRKAMQNAMWVGLPTITPGFQLRSLANGLIPTETRLRFRVDRPYSRYIPEEGMALKNNGFPLYTFSTQNLAPSLLGDAANTTDRQKLLDQIAAVPNPYYGYTGYEQNRLDTRVRIINLPRRATISIYSLDGSLVRRVEKSDPNYSFVDWDLRNAKGLPVGSGMYMMHVNAEGIGETIIRWFGSMRPIDITTF